MRQPPLRPPPWVFGPVWTVLYGAAGWAAHRAIGVGTAAAARRPSSYSSSSSSSSSAAVVVSTAASVYSAQLALNLAWMPLFFGARRPALALADLAALLGLNGYLAWLFFAAPQSSSSSSSSSTTALSWIGGGGLGDPVAGWCYVPYVAWLAFAAYLNLGVGYLNGWDISDEALLRRTGTAEAPRGKKDA